MKKVILIVLLIAVGFYAANLRYAIKAGKSVKGERLVVLVDKKTGDIKKLWGK